MKKRGRKFHKSPLFDILLNIWLLLSIFVVLPYYKTGRLSKREDLLMKRHFLFSFFSICYTFFIFGCASLQQTPPKVSMLSLERNAIITGSGGGFSGQYNGFVITHGGDVLSWQSPNGMPDSLALLFHTTPDSANFFFRYLDEIGFNDLAFSSSGNMNSFIERMTPETKHHVQWATDGGVSAPQEISTFYSLVRNYALRIPHK